MSYVSSYGNDFWLTEPSEVEVPEIKEKPRVTYILRDTRSYEDCPGESLYLSGLCGEHVGRREYALKYCCFWVKEDAMRECMSRDFFELEEVVD